MKEPRTKQWWLTRLGLTIVGRKGLGELNRASKDGKKAGAATLRGILSTSRDTVYGKEHHFEEILNAATPEEMFSLYQQYVPIYYEFANDDISITEAEEFTAYLDRCLQEYNPEYRDKRISGRLKEPEFALLQSDSFERFKEACLNRGYRDGQFKVNLLMQDEKRHAMFKELVK